MHQRLPLFPLRQVLVPGLVLPLTVFEERYRVMVAELLRRPPQERAFGVVALRQGRDAGTQHRVDDLHPVGCTALIREHDERPDGTYALVTAGAVRFRLHGVDESSGTPYLTGLVSPLDEPDGATDRTWPDGDRDAPGRAATSETDPAGGGDSRGPASGAGDAGRGSESGGSRATSAAGGTGPADGADPAGGRGARGAAGSPGHREAGLDAAAEGLIALRDDVLRRWTAYRERLGIAASGLPEGRSPAPVVLSYLVAAGMVLDLPERQRLLEVPDTTSRLRTERQLLRREDALISALRSLPAVDLASTDVNPN